MSIRICGVKLRVEFSFLIILTLTLLVTRSKDICIFAAVCAVHEAGHAAALYISGGRLAEVIISGFGIRMIPDRSRIFTASRSLIILLSGPAMNLGICSLMIIYGFSDSFAMMNLCAGLFNLLPYRTLDGGAALDEIIGCSKYGAAILNVMRLIPPAASVLAAIFIGREFLIPAAVMVMYYVNDFR